eukprot:COSAG01_NODE_2526_length_7501_cov_19.914618_3_plen_336_part_00
MHVEKPPIRVIYGFSAAFPWVVAVMAGIACTLLVVFVSVGFSERKTRAWLSVSLLGLIFKLLIFDPFKALCCGSLLEPILAVISCDFSGDALVELFEDVIELYSENAHFLAGEMRDDDVHMTREEAKVLAARAAHTSVFMSGSLAAKKLMVPVERMRKKALRQEQKEKVEHLTVQLQSDTDIINRRLEHLRQASNKTYADKISKKRRARGMSIGEFAQRAADAETTLANDSIPVDQEVAHIVQGVQRDRRKDDDAIKQRIAQRKLDSQRRLQKKLQTRGTQEWRTVPPAKLMLPDDPLAHMSDQALNDAVEQVKIARAAQRRADKLAKIDAQEEL